MRSSEALRLVFSTFTPEYRAQDVFYDRFLRIIRVLRIHELVRDHGAVPLPRDTDIPHLLCTETHKSVYSSFCLVIVSLRLQPNGERIERLESIMTQHPA